MGAAIEQEADGIDLGTDSGRLAARILIAVAKAAHERKSERQKLANEADAIGGKRRTGTPRPGREAAVEHACKLIRSGRRPADAGLRATCDAILDQLAGTWNNTAARNAGSYAAALARLAPPRSR